MPSGACASCIRGGGGGSRLQQLAASEMKIATHRNVTDMQSWTVTASDISVHVSFVVQLYITLFRQMKAENTHVKTDRLTLIIKNNNNIITRLIL